MRHVRPKPLQHPPPVFRVRIHFTRIRIRPKITMRIQIQDANWIRSHADPDPDLLLTKILVILQYAWIWICQHFFLIFLVQEETLCLYCKKDHGKNNTLDPDPNFEYGSWSRRQTECGSMRIWNTARRNWPYSDCVHTTHPSLPLFDAHKL